MGEDPQVQKKTSPFDLFDPISIIAFLSAFKPACDTNGMHKGADMWLLHFFMKKQAAAALKLRIALLPRSCRRRKEGALTTYWEVVNYLLDTYATDDVVAKTHARMGHYTQLQKKTPAEYADLLRTKVLRCDRVNDELVLKSA